MTRSAPRAMCAEPQPSPREEPPQPATPTQQEMEKAMLDREAVARVLNPWAMSFQGYNAYAIRCREEALSKADQIIGLLEGDKGVSLSHPCAETGTHIPSSPGDLAELERRVTAWADSLDRIGEPGRAAALRALLRDKARLDWLEMQCVEVRTPLVYGSRENFRARPDDSFEGEEGPSDIRAKIDAEIARSAISLALEGGRVSSRVTDSGGQEPPSSTLGQAGGGEP